MLYIQVEGFIQQLATALFHHITPACYFFHHRYRNTCMVGEKITEVGIGNGISMIIFAGIVANAQVLQGCFMDCSQARKFLLITLGIENSNSIGNLDCVLAVIMAVVWMEGGERRIPVQYAKGL